MGGFIFFMYMILATILVFLVSGIASIFINWNKAPDDDTVVPCTGWMIACMSCGFMIVLHLLG